MGLTDWMSWMMSVECWRKWKFHVYDSRNDAGWVVYYLERLLNKEWLGSSSVHCCTFVELWESRL